LIGRALICSAFDFLYYVFFLLFNLAATTKIYTLSLHDALPICWTSPIRRTARELRSPENSWSRKTVRPSFRLSWNQSRHVTRLPDRKSTRLNSSHSQISYAVFCLKKKNRDVKRHAD